MTDQLPLPFMPNPDFARLPLIPHTGIKEARAWLARTDWASLGLWGDAGTGKTHLLHHWAAQHGAAVVAGRDLEWPGLAGPLAIDDGNEAPIPALLHTLNAKAEARQPVLLTGRLAPYWWLVKLRDLHSRLAVIHAVRLHPPDDGFRARLFRRLLDDRQVAVSSTLLSYMLLRLPRDPATLRDAAARLDHAALAAQRAPTRAMAAAALAPLLYDISADALSNASPAAAHPG